MEKSKFVKKNNLTLMLTFSISNVVFLTPHCVRSAGAAWLGDARHDSHCPLYEVCRVL